MHFNDIETLFIAALALILGHFIHKFVPWTAKYHLPSSVLGGFVFAVALMAYRSLGGEVSFEIHLRDPLMILFFASLGFSASFSRLVAGGKPLIIFFALSSTILVLQNLIGIAFAMSIGQSPLFGIMTGSVSLVGGPGTALSFAPLFEKAGMQDAATIGLAASLGGIICAGLFGGPISTLLIQKFNLKSANRNEEISTRGEALEHYTSDDLTGHLMVNFGALVTAMCLGAYVSSIFVSLNITLPPYIGAMLIAAAIRNIDDKTNWIKIKETWLDSIGSVSLAFFIAMTMMTLDFLKLVDIGLPIILILALQSAVLFILIRYFVFPIMGRTYESAVLSGGAFGFLMGTAANAMANIETLQRKKGPAPNAGLYISLVGACFIDFANATVITVLLNFF